MLAVVDNISVIYVITDQNLNITSANEVFENLSSTQQQRLLTCCKETLLSKRLNKMKVVSDHSLYECLVLPVLNSAGDVLAISLTGYQVSRERLFPKFQEAILNNIGDVIFYIVIRDGEFYFEGVNPAFLKVTGLKEEMVLGKNIKQVIPENSHEVVLNSYRKAIKEMRTAKWEETSEYPAGVKYGEVSITPIFDSEGNCSEMIGVVHDITDRKLKDIQLSKNYSLLHAVVEGTTDAVFVKDLQGRYLMMNSTLVQWQGKPRKDLLGKTDAELFKDYTADIFVGNDQEVIVTGRTLTFQEEGFIGGQYRRFLSTKGPYRDIAGNIIGIIGISRDITDIKKSQDALEKSNSLLRATLDSTTDGILVIDTTNNIVLWNKRFLELWRIAEGTFRTHTYEELLGIVSSQLVHPDKCFERLEDIHAHPEAKSYDVIEFKDGRHFERYSLPQIMKGQIVGRVFCYRDFTARFEAERKLTESEKRKTAILNSSLDTIVTVDHEGRIMEVSPPVEIVFGYKMKEIIGQDLAGYFLPEELQNLFHLGLKKYLETGEQNIFGKRLEFTAKKADGTLFPVEVSTSLIKGEARPVFTAFIRDISERRTAERKIQEYAARARILADASAIFTAAELDLKRIGDAAVQWASETLKSGAILFLLTDEGRLEKISAYTLPGLDVSHLDAEAADEVLKSGVPIIKFLPDQKAPAGHNQQLICPLKIPGKIIGLMQTFRTSSAAYSDSDQEFLENLCDRAALAINNGRLFKQTNQALQLREDFIKIASHELRTPLTPLKLQLGMLNRFLKKGLISVGPKGQEVLDMIAVADQQVIRLSRLVEDMLDAIRMDTAKITLMLEEIDLTQVLKETLKDYQEQVNACNVPIHLATPESLSGHFDKRRIRQVIENLLSNALKYGMNKPVKITLEKKADVAFLAIEDQGMGIPEQDRGRIFGRFERGFSVNVFGGFGVGLFITRQIVEAHGGKIWVESTLGKGSTFTVELPCHPKE